MGDVDKTLAGMNALVIGGGGGGIGRATIRRANSATHPATAFSVPT